MFTKIYILGNKVITVFEIMILCTKFMGRRENTVYKVPFMQLIQDHGLRIWSPFHHDDHGWMWHRNNITVSEVLIDFLPLLMSLPVQHCFPPSPSYFID